MYRFRVRWWHNGVREEQVVTWGLGGIAEAMRAINAHDFAEWAVLSVERLA